MVDGFEEVSDGFEEVASVDSDVEGFRLVFGFEEV